MSADGMGESTKPGSWADLFAKSHRAAVTVLAGGVALFAINVYLTTSLLPNAIADIGGESLYSWTMTVFLVASVFTSMLVSRSLTRFGARRSYVYSLIVFGAGSVIAAAAPEMWVMLVGRGLQGLGAGLLAGLGFAVVRKVLPPRLWQRSIALMSAMWGVGNLVGPVVGGVFAQLGIWRGAFVLLAVAAAAIALLARKSLPVYRQTAAADEPVPWLALVLVASGAAAVSIASIVHGAATGILLGVAALFVIVFVVRDRATSVRVLPELTYRGRSPLRWIYASIVILALGSTIETFLPLFGQRIGGLSPLGAGFLGASVSWGWSVASILNGGVHDPKAKSAIRVTGPLLLAGGLIWYALLQSDDPGVARISLWFVALFIAGCGIGMAMAHWVTAVLGIGADDAEANKATAGINTSQMIANAFGSAFAGVLVSIGGPTLVGSARMLSWGYAVIAAIGIATAIRAIVAERVYSRRSESANLAGE